MGHSCEEEGLVQQYIQNCNNNALSPCEGTLLGFDFSLKAQPKYILCDLYLCIILLSTLSKCKGLISMKKVIAKC